MLNNYIKTLILSTIVLVIGNISNYSSTMEIHTMRAVYTPDLELDDINEKVKLGLKIYNDDKYKVFNSINLFIINKSILYKNNKHIKKIIRFI